MLQSGDFGARVRLGTKLGRYVACDLIVDMRINQSIYIREVARNFDTNTFSYHDHRRKSVGGD